MHWSLLFNAKLVVSGRFLQPVRCYLIVFPEIWRSKHLLYLSKKATCCFQLWCHNLTCRNVWNECSAPGFVAVLGQTDNLHNRILWSTYQQTNKQKFKMYFTPSKLGVASKPAINFQKLAIYTQLLQWCQYTLLVIIHNNFATNLPKNDVIFYIFLIKTTFFLG